ncbi:hypothetical protein EBZ35_05495, partial [bacterium]|nr:hypothetical protein [bacterium]
MDGLSWACLIVLAITPPSRLLQAFRRWWEGINSRGDQPITPIHKVANWTIWEMGLDVAKGVALVMLLPQLMPLDWIGVGIAGGLVLGSGLLSHRRPLAASGQRWMRAAPSHARP